MARTGLEPEGRQRTGRPPRHGARRTTGARPATLVEEEGPKPPYLPHAHDDVATMLARLGLPDMDALFAELPEDMRLPGPVDLGPALDEASLARRVGSLAAANAAAGLVCFAGGGVYDRYLPAAVQALAQRGEFLTAYTPYQPEVSQGTLQVTFEFQTMVSELFGLPVATAGLYDGSTALAEAVLMARAATGRKRVAFGPGVHPQWRAVVETYGQGQGLVLVDLDEAQADSGDVAAVVVQQPDYFGRVVDTAALLKRRPAGALGIVAVDPSTLGVLEAPGRQGADVVVGEGQPLGLPLAYGGPYLGLMAARQELLRRLPGRICGEGRDAIGRRAFVLTLQAREQHIRRARATSNVCTNQAWCALAVTIYLSLLGPEGLAELGRLGYARAHYAAGLLTRIPGVGLAFADAPFFHEFALAVPDADALQTALATHGFLVGPVVDAHTLLVAVTERRDRAEIDGLVAAMGAVMRDASA